MDRQGKMFVDWCCGACVIYQDCFASTNRFSFAVMQLHGHLVEWFHVAHAPTVIGHQVVVSKVGCVCNTKGPRVSEELWDIVLKNPILPCFADEKGK